MVRWHSPGWPFRFPRFAPRMHHLLDFTPAELVRWFADRGEPKYRAAQIERWLFERRAAGFDEMTDLGKSLRASLAGELRLWTTEIVNEHRAADGTEKLLLRLADGHTIECVLIREGARRTICISTQVGCAMGCVFCASGLEGVARNLRSGEIVEQMLRLSARLPADERLSHIVVMGMGEPLANLRALLPALSWATRESALGISARRITISTVGLPPAMRELAECGVPYRLAVSLHAPNDTLRNQLVPVNRTIGIAPILAEADRYFEVTGRRITFEYVLLGELNDRPEQARQLARLLAGRCALLNVIPYNPVGGLGYRSPTDESIAQFREILEAAGIRVRFRRRKGDQINAACGQLRRASKAPDLAVIEPAPAVGAELLPRGGV